ncbi:MAG: M13 family peptidase [Myxococcales bacterium]|nr:M13 family peptidase [Myxococcales bacterium]
MRRSLLVPLFLVAACPYAPQKMETVSGAGSPPGESADAPQSTRSPAARDTPASAQATAATLPAVTPATGPATGIDLQSLDRTVKPCHDFYRFACGGWLRRTEIPADRARWGSFSQIEERNLLVLRAILELDAAGGGDPQDPGKEKLGDLYGACMDERRIESAAAADLAAELRRVDGVRSIAALAEELARMHLGLANAFFQLHSQQDFKDATLVIATLDQGGLGLPDRDYYLKDDGKFPEIRLAYGRHVAKLFELSGARGVDAAVAAQTVLRIERALAEAQLGRVDRRDPAKIYHRLELAGIEQKAPLFPWRAYFKAIGHPDVKLINVAVPEYFAAVDRLLERVPMADWRIYLRWHTLHGAAPHLSRAFVDENFRFFGTTLTGARELPPRWKRCVQAADHSLGEALAQAFVRRTFGADGKRSTHDMVMAIERSMDRTLKQIGWMDDATRAEGFGKLRTIANKIGYPDRWRSYDALSVDRASHLRNMIAASTFETHRDLGKIGRPLDRGEWQMTPPTVNAYYEPSLNEMVFPAGILQPPFWNRAARQAVNYGAIGMVMGHELTHGFDDEGRKFDGQGNLRQWWTASVNEEFERRAACVVKQFDGYVAVDDLHLNGKLTLGENIADLGGIKLAYHAFAAEQAEGHLGSPVQGEFSDEQLFFLGIAQAWCTKTRDENARMRVTVDPHSPPENRVNGPLSNLAEFAAAWQCGPGSRMVRAEQCVIW